MTAQLRETAQARSGRRRREATIADILDATRRLLEAGTPVANLSVERIVLEAGIARATFYLHFSDKHALIAQLADEEIAWREQIGIEALADPRLERATLDAMLLDIIGRWAEDRAVLSAIIELAEYDANVREIWRAAMARVAESGAAQLRARWKEDPAAPASPDTIAEILAWGFERCCHQMLVDPRRVPELAESFAEIVWRVLDYRPRWPRP